jgi:hypothetical protein
VTGRLTEALTSWLLDSPWQALIEKGQAWRRQSEALLSSRAPLKRMRDTLHAGLRLPVEMPEVEQLRLGIRRCRAFLLHLLSGNKATTTKWCFLIFIVFILSSNATATKRCLALSALAGFGALPRGRSSARTCGNGGVVVLAATWEGRRPCSRGGISWVASIAGVAWQGSF